MRFRVDADFSIGPINSHLSQSSREMVDERVIVYEAEMY